MLTHTTATKETNPKLIQRTVLTYRQDVNYFAAHRAKEPLLENTIEQDRKAFENLRSILIALREFNP